MAVETRGYTKAEVPPNDFEVKDHLWNSPFQNSEKEIIARNLILLSQWNENQWLEFSWEGYQLLCKHNVTLKEKDVLDWFVSEGLLRFRNEKYSITDHFIWYLRKFIKK